MNIAVNTIGPIFSYKSGKDCFLQTSVGLFYTGHGRILYTGQRPGYTSQGIIAIYRSGWARVELLCTGHGHGILYKHW